ncbi:MAG: type IV pilus twitching motility protein PilT [Planctomycetota bacterium]
MSAPTKEELLFGRIALLNKLINQQQYEKALQARQQRDPADVNQDFGRILKALGFLDDKQYRSIRKAQEKALAQKGHSADAAKFLARGMNADGTAPGAGGPTPAASAPSPPAHEAADDFDPGGDDGGYEEPVEAEEVVAVTPVAGGATPKRTWKRPHDPRALKTMEAMLKKARDSGASDLHLSCGAKPLLRLHGALTPLNMPEISREQGSQWAASVMSDESWSSFMETKDWDGSVDIRGVGRFRANVLQQRRGVSSVYRVINTVIPTLDGLGLPKSFERFTTFHQGMVLVTGSTGSGKSSTLAAMIDIINDNRKEHVITMEDPIEFVYTGKNCNITQRQIGEHTRSWGNALRASLREDPDVILIGEMRDLDTVSLAITAAETGHLVFGTLHTNSAIRTIDRLLDVFPPGEQPQIRAMVSESLKGVISQQLLKKADGKGRVCAFEVLCWTPAVANIIREGTTYKLLSVLQTGKKLGMILMDDSLKGLLKEGLISKEAARVAAHNPKNFQ